MKWLKDNCWSNKLKKKKIIKEAEKIFMEVWVNIKNRECIGNTHYKGKISTHYIQTIIPLCMDYRKCIDYYKENKFTTKDKITVERDLVLSLFLKQKMGPKKNSKILEFNFIKLMKSY